MNGAGGTSGGSGQFLLGLIMMCGGFYLLVHLISGPRISHFEIVAIIV